MQKTDIETLDLVSFKKRFYDLLEGMWKNLGGMLEKVVFGGRLGLFLMHPRVALNLL